jgi:hypothetical protein
MASRFSTEWPRKSFFPVFLRPRPPRPEDSLVGGAASAAAVLVLLLSGGIKILAQTTSLLILTVFVMVHLSLLTTEVGQKGGKKGRHPLSPSQFSGDGLPALRGPPDPIPGRRLPSRERDPGHGACALGTGEDDQNEKTLTLPKMG